MITIDNFHECMNPIVRMFNSFFHERIFFCINEKQIKIINMKHHRVVPQVNMTWPDWETLQWLSAHGRPRVAGDSTKTIRLKHWSLALRNMPLTLTCSDALTLTWSTNPKKKLPNPGCFLVRGPSPPPKKKLKSFLSKMFEYFNKKKKP